MLQLFKPAKPIERIVNRKPKTNMKRRKSRLRYTKEQRHIIENTSHRIVVQACAGSGKTSVLKAYAMHRPLFQCVYISFNKHTRQEAAASFPPNVRCVTFDALAYRNYIHKVPQHQTISLKPFNVHFIQSIVAGTTFRTQQGDRIVVPHHVCQQILDTLKKFSTNTVYANDARIHQSYVDKSMVTTTSHKRKRKHIAFIAQLAQWVWQTYLRRRAPFMCHELNRLVLWSEGFESMLERNTILLIDEAQDLNAPMVATLKACPYRLVVVGDRNQQIYQQLLGSVNAIEALQQERGIYHCILSKSFRFGTTMASLLTRLVTLVSNNTRSKTIIRSATKQDTTLLTSHDIMQTPFVALFRTNKKLLVRAHLFTQQYIYIHIIGWTTLRLQLLSRNSSMKPVLDSYSEAFLHNMINDIDHYHKQYAAQADVVLSTIHKFKGQQADRVWIHNDIQLKTYFAFDQRQQCIRWSDREREEAHLLYVALSRAKKQIRVDFDVEQYVHDIENLIYHGDKAEMIMVNDTSAPAMIRICGNKQKRERVLYLLKQ